jgi:hypothetical protein
MLPARCVTAAVRLRCGAGERPYIEPPGGSTRAEAEPDRHDAAMILRRREQYTRGCGRLVRARDLARPSAVADVFP